MKTYIVVLCFVFSVLAYGNDALNAYNMAKDYEKAGDLKQAMYFYKKAASLSINNKMDKNIIKSEDNSSKKINKEQSILRFGKNSIHGYTNEHTDDTVKQIIMSAFDIKPYKMNYLLPITYDFIDHSGRKNMETKFQISFKKSLAKNLFGVEDELFLGYTQTSWWQTSEPSSPFRETNYEPEFFMVIPNVDDQSPLKAYQIGLVHQSNGQGGLLSRSWNRVYLSTIWQKKGFFIVPKVWYRFPERKKAYPLDANGDDNPDIYDYLGYGDLTISYPYRKNFFTLTLRDNLKFDENNKGSIRFDWTFPIKGVESMFGYVQYFYGYGESLIDYNKRNSRIGIGFAITR